MSYPRLHGEVRLGHRGEQALRKRGRKRGCPLGFLGRGDSPRVASGEEEARGEGGMASTRTCSTRARDRKSVV